MYNVALTTAFFVARPTFLGFVYECRDRLKWCNEGMTFAEHVAFDMVAVCVAKVKKYVRLLVHCESNVSKMLRNHYAKK